VTSSTRPLICHLAQALGEMTRIHHLAQADAAARDLVLVGGTDATPRGADGLLATGNLPCLVQRHMVGKNERAGLAQTDAAARLHARLFQLGQLLQQRFRGEHHPVADEATHPFTQDTRGDEVQHRLPAVDDQGMAGVVPALETHHGIRLVGKEIDDLALALITPLGADDHYILSHFPFSLQFEI